MTLPANARLVAYLRDSGGPDQELSVLQQEATVRAWAAENGHSISNIFIDEAQSGTRTAGRHGFEAMLQHFRDPACTDHGLVVWKFSRLARDFDDAQFFKADLRRRGFAVFAIQDKVPEGTMGRFFEAAIDYMNERYSKDLATDVQRGLRHAIANHGTVPGNKTKPGFKREQIEVGTKRHGHPHLTHRWVIDPDVAPRVLEAFRLKAAGATALEIHNKTHLYSTVHGYSYLWNAEIYRGRFKFGRDPANHVIIENYVDPIVDEATWNAVQERVRDNRERHFSSAHHPRRVASRHLLSGLVKCHNCGYMLIAGSSENKYKVRYGYYTCKSGNMRPALGCKAYGISCEKLEQAVLRSVGEFILSPANLEHLYGLVQSKALQARAKSNVGPQASRRLKKVNAELTNIVEAISTAGHSPSLLQRLTTLEAERAKLISELQSRPTAQHAKIPTFAQVSSAAQRIAADLASQDRPTMKRVLAGLIKEIVVQRVGKHVHGTISYYLPQNEIMPIGLGFQQPTGQDFGKFVSSVKNP